VHALLLARMKFAKIVFRIAGVGLAWQFAFFAIATDPARFRPTMIPSVLEKVSQAGLFQLKSDRGNGVPAGPEVCARKVPFLAAQSGDRDGALALRKPRSPTPPGVWAESRCTYAHGPA